MDKTIVLVNIQSALAVSLQCPSVQNTMAIDQTPSKDSSGNVQKDNGNTEYDQTFLMGGKQLDDKTARYFYEVVIGLQRAAWSTQLEAYGYHAGGDADLYAQLRSQGDQDRVPCPTTRTST